MPLERFCVETKFEIVGQIRNGKVKDFFLTLACGVHEVYIFDGIVAVVPSHVKGADATICKGGKNIDGVMKNVMHRIVL